MKTTKYPRFIYPMALASLVFFLIARPVLAEEPSGDKRQLVPIGMVVPLTGFGSVFGIPIVKEAGLLIKRFNKQSTRYHYQLIIEDGKCGGGAAPVTAAQKLINIDKVRLLLTGCSGETLPIGPLAQKYGVVTIALFSNHHDVRKLGDYIFRTFYDIEEGIELTANTMIANEYSRVAILAEENAFTMGMAESLKEKLSKRVVSYDEYSSHAPDLRAFVLSAKRRRPETVYLSCAGPGTCAELISHMRKQGMKLPIFTYYYLNYPEVAKAGKQYPGNIFYLTVPENFDSSSESREFFKMFREKHSNVITDEFVLRSAYDGLSALVNSVEAVGPDSKKVKDYLYNYRERGALGLVEFDEAGDIRDLKLRLLKFNPFAPQ